MKELSKQDINKINEYCAHFDITEINEKSPVFERRVAQFYLICQLYILNSNGALDEMLWAEKQNIGFRILDLLEGREND
jgi:hypothetical protein